MSTDGKHSLYQFAQIYSHDTVQANNSRCFGPMVWTLDLKVPPREGQAMYIIDVRSHILQEMRICSCFFHLARDVDVARPCAMISHVKAPFSRIVWT